MAFICHCHILYLLQCMKQEILALHGIRGEFLTDKCVDGEAKLYLKGRIHCIVCITNHRWQK